MRYLVGGSTDGQPWGEPEVCDSLGEAALSVQEQLGVVVGGLIDDEPWPSSIPGVPLKTFLMAEMYFEIFNGATSWSYSEPWDTHGATASFCVFVIQVEAC